MSPPGRSHGCDRNLAWMLFACGTHPPARPVARRDQGRPTPKRSTYPTYTATESKPPSIIVIDGMSIILITLSAAIAASAS